MIQGLVARLAASRDPCQWVVVVALLMSGCGAKDEEPILVDARALLDRYQQERLRHDPRHFSEIELGEFFVTQRRDAALLSIRVRLVAVVSDTQLDQFQTLLQGRLERVHATIRQTIQRAGPAQLDEGSLDSLKSELIRSINGCLEKRIVQDVAFAKFSLERG
jgi:hypothetical protein